MTLIFRTRIYSQNIYRFGVTTLESIPASYYVPVQQYVAETYARTEIDNALAQGYITQQQYDETIAYIPA